MSFSGIAIVFALCIIHTQSRASGSVDVTVVNNSSKTFLRTQLTCEWGAWSKQAFPQDVLPKQALSSYVIENRGFMTGEHCKVEYVSTDKSAKIELDVSNPYRGRNYVSGTHSTGPIAVTGSMTRKSNGNVVFVIVDKSGRKRQADEVSSETSYEE